MTEDPRRLKDSGPDDLRDLLREGGRVKSMTDADRAAILTGLGVVGTGAAAGSVTKAAVTAATKSKLVLVLLSVVGIGVGGVLGAMSLAHRGERTEAPSSAVSVTTAPVAPPPSSATSATSAPSAAPVADPVPTTTATPAPPTKAAPTPTAQADGEDTLSAESTLIGKARTSIEGSPADALALLADHARRFPHGQLAAERDFLMIKALRKLGRIDEARTRARGYPARYPSSPYVPAVRSMAAEMESR